MFCFIIRRRKKKDEALAKYIMKGNPHPHTIRFMINRGARVNARDNHSNSMLHLVMRHCKDNIQVVRMMLKSGADPNAVSVVKKTPLRMAIKYRQDISVIKELINYGADVNCQDRHLNTPLHVAVIKKLHYVVNILLQHKANVNIANDNENSVLHACVLLNDFQTLKKILHYKNLKIDLEAKNRFKETPLMCAVKGDNLKIVSELLLFGASVATTDGTGSTLLHAALMKSPPNLELVDELLRYNADIYFLNNDISSPVHLAVNKYYEPELDNFVSTKALIKYDVLQNGDRTFQFSHHIGTRPGIYSKLEKFCEACLYEVGRMKSEFIDINFTLHEFVIQCLNKRAILVNKTNYKTSIIDRILRVFRRYPIYQDIIITCVEKKYLLRKITDIRLRAKVRKEERLITLDFDSLYIICDYLSNSDILNLIEAF
ncbi:ankyrin-1 [Nephila pilipes]|uniref:Ankyrin-1 n=1 Tax=Nephila pilipes TaxID=299642 RepID=A0A8X6N2G0_NEPPI|nr:ankyrin-1 [Nephila pilipes]